MFFVSVSEKLFQPLILKKMKKFSTLFSLLILYFHSMSAQKAPCISTMALVDVSILEGETYSFYGQSLHSGGTYKAILKNAAGCDSIVTLELVVVPPPSSQCFATSVTSYIKGKKANGQPLSILRTKQDKALGFPEPVVDNIVNFVALGFGGQITLAFSNPIANGPGDDLKIDEATWFNRSCNVYPEKADVFASMDNITFVLLGRACQDGQFDLGALPSAQYVKIVDVSEKTSFSGSDDGYDVNGIACLNASH
jgi:hypothetical protein